MVIVAMALIPYWIKVLKYFESCENARISDLTKALKCGLVKDLSKNHLEGELATAHFKRCTGIRLENEPREMLLQLYKDNKEKLKFPQLKRALPYIVFSDDGISIHVSAMERIFYWSNLLASMVLIFLGALLVIISILSRFCTELTLFQSFKIWGMGMVYFVVAFFFILQVRVVKAADKVGLIIR